MSGSGSSRKAHDFLRSITAFSDANTPTTSGDRPVRLGIVDYDYDPNDFLGGINPRIQFDGESTVSQKRYQVMPPFYPLPGQRVALLPIGTSYLIIGCVDTIPQDAKVDIFTASDTWEKPDGARECRIQVQGGGGAGGGSATTPAGNCSAGGGGAGGAYAESWIKANSLGATEQVTVGAGGVGAANTTGTNGSTSSFGSGPWVSASGGNGGGFVGAGTTNRGVNGADSTTQTMVGDIQIAGGGGGSAMAFSTQGALGGIGGGCQLGSGGRGKSVTTGVAAGDIGLGYGGGGSGSVNGATGNTGLAGGNGASGVVIITTYY